MSDLSDDKTMADMRDAVWAALLGRAVDPEQRRPGHIVLAALQPLLDELSCLRARVERLEAARSK